MADDSLVWVPVLPSLRDFARELDKGTKGAGTKTGERVGKEIADGVAKSQAAVDKAAEVAEKAHNRVADAAGKVRVAEEQLNKARSSGDAIKVARAEEQLATARRRQGEATTSAENADKTLATRRERLTKATDESTIAAREQTDALKLGEGAMDGMGGKVSDLVGKLGGLAAGFAGVAGAAGLAATGFDVDAQIDLMNRQLGMTGEAAAMLGDEVGQVMRTGVAGSAEDAAQAVGALTSQFSYLGFEGEQTAAGLSDNFLAFTDTFGTDMVEATQTAGQLIQNGLATDVEQAADLMTTAMQRVPAAMRDELPEIMNEYGTNFASLGFDGKEAFDLLVTASADGKIALDKTGDALKEFGIRATDLGDTAAVEALESLGLAGEDVQARLLAGGDTARGAFTQVTDALVGVTDPAKQAEAAVALFGTPLEDLDKTKLPAFLDSLNATGEGMSGFEGSSQALSDTISGSLAGRIDALKGTVSDLAGDGFMKLWDAALGVSEWAQSNSTWLTPLLVGLGTMAGIVTGIVTATWAWNTALGVYKTVQAIATGQQLLFNSALLSNPITWIVIAIAALVAGLVYFFTQTELGQQIWDSFTAALLSGWEWVKAAFASAWAVISPIFTSIMNAAKMVAGVVVTGFLLYVQAYWFLVSNAISFAYNSIIRPTFDALAAAASWLWVSVLMPVFDWIRGGWQLLASGVQSAYESIIRPTFDAVGSAATWLWQNVLVPAFEGISLGWRLLGDGLRWVVDNVVHPVFEGLKTGLGFVETAFSKAVDFIGQVWNRIKSITAAPVKFVIDTVYNDGIRAVWNKVAGWLNLDELDPWRPAWLGDYASGGVLPGYTPGRDIYEFIEPSTGMTLGLGGGEGIMRPEFVDMVGGEKGINDLNMRARKGLPLGHAGNYAAGGVLPGWEMLTTDIQRAMAASVAQAFPNQRISSGTRYEEMGAGFDNHMQGRAVDFGLPGGPLASWIASEYGPSVLELFWDPGPNMVGGAPTGAIGGHSDHVHWAMASIIDPYTGDVISEGGQGGGGVSPVGGLVRAAFDSVIDPIMDKFPTFGGTFGEMPKALATKMIDGLQDFIMSKIPGAGGSSDHGDWVGAAGVEQFRPLVEKLLREKGHDLGLVGSVLRRMNQESTGDPNAINNWDSNALAGWPTKGLMQMRDDTFASNADPGYGNIWDPEHNLRSSLNYAMREYGSISAAYDRAGGYDQGGVLAEGVTLAVNESGKPEAILTNQQWKNISALVHELQFLTPEMKRWVDEGLVELERFANAAEKGFNEWAQATTEQGRMGSAEEIFADAAGQYGVSLADGALSMIGLGGIAGGKFNDSFTNLLNEAGLLVPLLSPPSLLDDSGRAIGTQLEAETGEMAVGALGELDMSAPVVPITDDVADVSAEQLPAGTQVTVALPSDKTAYSSEEVKRMLTELDSRVDDLEIRVEDSDNAPAPLGAGVSGIV